MYKFEYVKPVYLHINRRLKSYTLYTIMKKLLLVFIGVLLIGITPKFVKAQALQGTYINSEQQIVFNKDSINYCLISGMGMGIVTPITGKGTYTIKKNRLLIIPEFSKEAEFKIEPIASNNGDSLLISVITIEPSNNKTPIVGASVIAYKNKKTICGNWTNRDGIARLTRSKIIESDSIKVSFIGFRNAYFKVSNSYNYKVILTKGTSNDSQYHFITNKNKGYDIKRYKDSIKLRLPFFEHHKMTYKWIAFIKK